MKRKIIFGIVAGMFAVATVFSFNLSNANNAGNVSLDDIAVMAQAQSELTPEQKKQLLSMGQGTYIINPDGSFSMIACGKTWDVIDRWYNTDGGDFRPFRELCSGTVGSETTSYGGSYDPSVSYGGATVGSNATGNYSNTTDYSQPYQMERVVCAMGHGNCINGEDCTRV